MKTIIPCAVLLAALSFPLTASAQSGDESRTYFEIGAKAYQAGRYLDAIQAFEEAYRRSSRPGLLFSLGQAHRMEYFARSDPARLKDSVRYYAEYLQKEPGGKRAGEATEQLAKLKPLAESMGGGSGATPAAAPVAALPGKPKVMISSPTEGVKVTFDGKAVPHPYIAEVEPGKHKVVLSAAGHEDYTRELAVDAKTGAPPLDVPLKEKPAQLVIRAPDGAEVAIDGRLQGTTPLPALAVPSGTHFIAVIKNGKQAFSTRVKLVRGERKVIDADLENTGQRTASWVMIGVGAAGIVAGGVLGFVSLRKQSQAKDILDQSEDEGNLSSSELGRYEDLRASRDRFRTAAFITASAGVGVGAIGLMLNLFDQPKAPLPPAEEEAPGAPKRPEAPTTMEISAVPLLTPGFAGGALGGRF